MCFGVAPRTKFPRAPINSTRLHYQGDNYSCRPLSSAIPTLGIYTSCATTFVASFGTDDDPIGTIQVDDRCTRLFTWWEILPHPGAVRTARRTRSPSRRTWSVMTARPISTRARVSSGSLWPRRRYSTLRRTGPRVQGGLELCNAAYNSSSIANLSNVSGNYWMAAAERPTRCSTPS